jgi:hypothetical protein
MGLETPVFHAVNDRCEILYQNSQLKAQTPRLGSTIARLKLKGIDRRADRRWNIAV